MSGSSCGRLWFCRAFSTELRPSEWAGPVEKSRAPKKCDRSPGQVETSRRKISGYSRASDREKVQHRAFYGLFFPPIGTTIWVYPQAARGLPSERGIGPMAVTGVLLCQRARNRSLGACAAENFSGTTFPERVAILQKTGEIVPVSVGYSPIVGTMVYLKALKVFPDAGS